MNCENKQVLTINASRVRKVSEPKSVKDPNAPKKALTSYMFFCKEKRVEIKASNPGLKLPQISKLLGAAWKALSEQEKKVYVDTALADKLRYSNEMSGYNRPSESELLEEKKSVRKRTISNVSGVKRPVSSYMFFSKDKTREIKDVHPEFTFKEINSELGRMWREVFNTSECREKWVKLAEADKIRYYREKTEFLNSDLQISDDLVVDKGVLANLQETSHSVSASQGRSVSHGRFVSLDTETEDDVSKYLRDDYDM
jgi:hypothetical protein